MQGTSIVQNWGERNQHVEEWNNRQAEETNRQAMHDTSACQGKESTLKQTHQPKRPYFSQPRTGFKKPRKTSMFDVFRGER